MAKSLGGIIRTEKLNYECAIWWLMGGQMCSKHYVPQHWLCSFGYVTAIPEYRRALLFHSIVVAIIRKASYPKWIWFSAWKLSQLRFLVSSLHSKRTLYWRSLCIVKWAFSHISDTRTYLPSHHAPLECITWHPSHHVSQVKVCTDKTDSQTRTFHKDYLHSNTTKSSFRSSSMSVLPSPGNTPKKKNGKRCPWCHLDQSPIPFHALPWTAPPKGFELNSDYSKQHTI